MTDIFKYPAFRYAVSDLFLLFYSFFVVVRLTFGKIDAEKSNNILLQYFINEQPLDAPRRDSSSFSYVNTVTIGK